MTAPPHLGGEELARRLPFAALVESLTAAFLSPASAPVRQRSEASNGREFLVMPAVGNEYAGAKLLTIVPDNASCSANVIQGVYVLFDFKRGGVLATLDADELTARRTAAVSALASGRLSRRNSTRLLLVGSGHLIPYLAETHCAVRPIRVVWLWARDPLKAKGAADLIRGRIPGILVEIAEDLATATQTADIVCVATRSANPLIAGDWLTGGAHVDLVGGYRPDMREIDDEGVRRARLYVDTRAGALVEAGDLLSPLSRGVIAASDILGDLTDLAAGAGRGDPGEITLFKSVGWASADLAAAVIAWRVAPDSSSLDTGQHTPFGNC